MTAFKKLEVWQDAISLVNSFRRVSEDLIQSREYELKNQLVRCAISIPSNIAEGASSGSDKNFIRYLNISLGSIAEFQTQLEISVHWNLLDPEEAKIIIQDAERLAYRLRKLKKYLARNTEG